MMGKRSISPGNLVHFTPLRYPGGKGKLAEFVKRLIEVNRLSDGDYVEPYAGGAAVALELLFTGYVSHVHINDLSRPIYAFWKAVLTDSERLIRLVLSTKLNVTTWRKQRAILRKQEEHDDLTVGFAAFYLNRTNRSGILNGGVIGGLDQSGPWKIDARYNGNELAFRIERIAALSGRISLTRMDALQFLQSGSKYWTAKTLIYLDPPYFMKGRQLYDDYYVESDHERLARFVSEKLTKQRWIVSYDNVREVRALYRQHSLMSYGIAYSARIACEGTEIMFFGPGVKVPPAIGPIRQFRRRIRLAA